MKAEEVRLLRHLDREHGSINLMRPMLFFISGSLKGATLTPHGDRLVLGTDPANAVRIPR
jgi:hypothetical protein